MEIFGRNRNSDQRFLICVILLFLITSLYHIYAGMDFFRSTGIFPESLVDDYDMYERIFSASKDVLKDSPLTKQAGYYNPSGFRRFCYTAGGRSICLYDSFV